MKWKLEEKETIYNQIHENILNQLLFQKITYDKKYF